MRKITINPSDLKPVKKKKKVDKEELGPITINTTNIRKLLLEKLKAHKKSKKNVRINNNTFGIENKSVSDNKTIKNYNPNNTFNHSVEQPLYGNLKNGVKPTYRILNDYNPINNCTIPNIQSNENSLQMNENSLQTNENSLQTNENRQPILQCDENSLQTNENSLQTNENRQPILQCDENNNSLLQIKEVKKIFNLGKNKKNRTISVMLHTRKNKNKENYNTKTKINTIKNKLKLNNLIKYGSNAPYNLLKDIYISTIECGDIINTNSKVLMHNYNLNTR